MRKNLRLTIVISLIAFSFINLIELKAQQLGIYFPPNSDYTILSQEGKLSHLGFKAILLPHDQYHRFEPEKAFSHFIYPNIITSKYYRQQDANEWLKSTYQNMMSPITGNYLFVGFLPNQLFNLGIQDTLATNAFYLERIPIYSRKLDKVAEEKEKWLFLSKYDLPFIDEKELKGIHSLIWVSYDENDLSLNYLNHLVDLADSLNVGNLFIDARYLDEALKTQKNLTIYLRSIGRAERPSTMARLPSLLTATLYDQAYILIFVLLLLFALHATFSGKYMRSLKRYLGNSRFFLQEIQYWRDSITVNAFIVLIQFISLHTLVQFIFLSLLFSPNAILTVLNSFSTSVPTTSIILPLFLYALLFILNALLHLLIVIANYFTSTGFNYFGQSLAIYAYGFHTHLLIGIPIFLIIRELPLHFSILSFALFFTLLVIPFNHLRAQLQTIKCGGNDAIKSIIFGYAGFWISLIGVLIIFFFTNSAFIEQILHLMATP